jgi:hypothetical protein
MACDTVLRLALFAGAAVQHGAAVTSLEGFRTLDYRPSSFQNSHVREPSPKLSPSRSSALLCSVSERHAD